MSERVTVQIADKLAADLAKMKMQNLIRAERDGRGAQGARGRRRQRGGGRGDD